MTYYEDGERLGERDGSDVLALGWLDSVHPIRSGEVPPAVIDVLELAQTAPVSRTRSWYQCPLCDVAGLVPTHHVARTGSDLLLGHATLEVVGGSGTIWRMPDLVLHYVKEHNYLPPEAFLADV